MKLTIKHTLTFSLGTPSRAVQHLLLTASSTPQQKIERWSIEAPGINDAATFRDAFGNKAHLVSQVKPSESIVVTVSGVVETIDKSGVLGKLEYDPMPALFRRPTELTKPDTSLLDAISEEGGRIALLHELMERVHDKLAAPEQMQASGSQSQSQSQGSDAEPVDFAHAFIGGARALGIPARYVTGYLWDEGKASFHAWAEAWDEGLGWIGFDPMLNVCPTDQHIRLASALDAIGAMPIRSSPVWPEMPDEVVEIIEG
ncbi:MAG: transglutaminase family protein [Devosia sp.]